MPLIFPSLCASASLREIVYFFTASSAWVTRPIPFQFVSPEGADHRRVNAVGVGVVAWAEAGRRSAL